MRLRLEQRKSLDRRLQHMLIAPRPDYLATADEQSAAARIEQLEARARRAQRRPGRSALRAADRTPAGRADLEPAGRTTTGASPTRTRTCASSTRTSSGSTAQYDAFVRTRQARDAQLRRLRGADRGPARARSRARSSGSTGCMTRQGEVLETVAIQRARRAPRAARGLPEPGALRVRRQLRPRRQGAGGGAVGSGMMRWQPHGPALLAPALAAACAGDPDRQTLAEAARGRARRRPR